MKLRTALIALVAFCSLSGASYADSGTVTLTIYKAGWIIGGSGGSGILDFNGRRLYEAAEVKRLRQGSQHFLSSLASSQFLCSI